VVESQPSKLLVVGSIPISRSRTWPLFGRSGDLAVAFEQAEIKVQREPEFQRLRTAVERALAPAAAGAFLAKLKSRGLRVRQWEEILEARLLEFADPELKRSGQKAKDLYQSLPLSDQALMRELYLEQVEKVDAVLRRKFHTVYTMY
jgi:hypothetical protein